jgi:hypothetical protein
VRRAAGRLSHDDPLVDLVKSATWLANAGRSDAFDLSPKQIAWAVRVAEEDQRRATKADAIAVAIGTHGDKKAWTALDG